MSERWVSCPVCGSGASRDAVELAGYWLYCCARCTLRFAPDAFQATVDYDSVYQSTEYRRDQIEELRSLDPQQMGEHPTYRAFFERVPHSPGARLLDIGCGVGRFGHGAYARGWDVTGIDVSELAIEIGRQAASFPMRAGTLKDLVNTGERFDVVTAFEVLEHLSAPLQFIMECQQLLRPGGQVFFTVPNWEARTVRTSTRPDWLPPIHLLFFSEPALQTLGELARLAPVSTGVIRADPIPERTSARARWLARRLLLRPRDALGLWLHGRVPS
jgi:2-polyprenyl-3-methyl-5-hydroxy-6-metoxy-1,4-benzoquinol methylase